MPLPSRSWSVKDRFDAKWIPEPNTGCWLWTAVIEKAQGYGKLMVSSRSRRAHRVAWELYRGPIPEGLVIDHLCRVRSCVNPDHLRVVTHRVNATENSLGPSALNVKKTHCYKGHEFSSSNTRVATGWRSCITCVRASNLIAAKKYRQSKRNAT